MRYSTFLPESKCVCKDNRRESDTRPVKKLGIRAMFQRCNLVSLWGCQIIRCSEKDDFN